MSSPPAWTLPVLAVTEKTPTHTAADVDVAHS